MEEKNKKKVSLGKIEEVLGGVLLAIMAVVVFVGTGGRYTKIFSLPWADELSRYLMVWMIFVGVAAGANYGEHFHVTAFTGKLPIKGQRGLGYFRIALVSLFSLYVAYKMFYLIQRAFTTNQLSPALHLPMGVIYMAVPLGMFFFAFSYAIHELAKLKALGTTQEVEDEVSDY